MTTYCQDSITGKMLPVAEGCQPGEWVRRKDVSILSREEINSRLTPLFESDADIDEIMDAIHALQLPQPVVPVQSGGVDASTKCPICGIEWPHAHSEPDLVNYLKGIRESYAKNIMSQNRRIVIFSRPLDIRERISNLLEIAFWTNRNNPESIKESEDAFYDILYNPDANARFFELVTENDTLKQKLAHLTATQSAPVQGGAVVSRELWHASEIVLDAFKRRVSGYQLDYEMETLRIETLEQALLDSKSQLPHLVSPVQGGGVDLSKEAPDWATHVGLIWMNGSGMSSRNPFRTFPTNDVDVSLDHLTTTQSAPVQGGGVDMSDVKLFLQQIVSVEPKNDALWISTVKASAYGYLRDLTTTQSAPVADHE